MEVIIKGKRPTDPRDRVLAIEAATQAICEGVDQDPADCAMMLLTAAVHLTMKHTDKPIKDVAPVMASALGAAIVMAHRLRRRRVRKM